MIWVCLNRLLPSFERFFGSPYFFKDIHLPHFGEVNQTLQIQAVTQFKVGFDQLIGKGLGCFQLTQSPVCNRQLKGLVERSARGFYDVDAVCERCKV